MAIVREEMGASPPVPKYRTDPAELVYEPGIAEWMSKFCVDIDFVRTHITWIGTSASCRKTLNWQ
jgi:hypothetical protein